LRDPRAANPDGIEIDVSDGADSAPMIGYGATAYQVTPWRTLLRDLTDGNVDDFDDSGQPFGPADFTGGFQWSTTITPGSTESFLTQFASNAPRLPRGASAIPEPSSALLAGLGFLVLGLRSRPDGSDPFSENPGLPCPQPPLAALTCARKGGPTTMNMQIQGKIHATFDAAQVTERFRKREFVLELEGTSRYPQYVMFQLTGDRCEALDGFDTGHEVAVEFSLRGREWTSPKGEIRFFNSLEVWSIDRVSEGAASGSGGSSAAGPAASDAPPPPTDDDDIPF